MTAQTDVTDNTERSRGTLTAPAVPGSDTDVAAAAARPRTPRIPLRTRLVAIDVTALAAGWLIATLLVPVGLPGWIDLVAGVGVVLAGLCLLAMAKLYKGRVSSVRATELTRIGPVALGAVGTGMIVASLLSQSLPWARPLVALVTVTVCLVVGRSAFDDWLRAQRTAGNFQRRIVLVGAGDEMEKLETLTSEHADIGFTVTASVHTDAAGDPGLIGRVMAALAANAADGAMLTARGFTVEDKSRLISHLSAEGIHVHVSAGLWGIDQNRLRPVPVAHEPLMYVEPVHLSSARLALKRVADVVVAAVLMVLASPVLALAAIGTLLDSGGPVVFRQVRIGRHGRPFTLYKLRTMTTDAETQLIDLTADNGRDGPLFKAVGNDPRVTRFGRLLRALSIDELPQLVNVLKGDMSLVGPRPALPEEVERFDELLRSRHRMLPGITGLWQVEARDKPSFWAYRRLDLFYVDNWSPMLDIVIVVMTVQSVIGRSLRHLRRSETTALA